MLQESVSEWMQTALQLVAAAASALVAIILHEVAHGWAAAALGDQTARRAGRLSIKPWRHVDRVGTLLVPGLLLAGQLLALGRVAFLFGWAKPVPVSTAGFAHPRRGMMLVAAAGPAMNFCLAWLGALALHGVGLLEGDGGAVFADALSLFILYNLALGLFNLLPLPPLDGGRIVVGLLPRPLALGWARIERFGIVLVLAGLFVLPALLRQAGLRFDPLHGLLGRVLPAAFGLTLWLAGSPSADGL